MVYASYYKWTFGARQGKLLFSGLQFADPDVAVTDWMIVVLQRKGQFFWRCSVWWPNVMAGGTGQFDIVLNQHSVVKNCHMRCSGQLSGRIEPWAVPDDVISLPLTGSARGVHQWRILPVDRRGLAIGVGLALVGI